MSAPRPRPRPGSGPDRLAAAGGTVTVRARAPLRLGLAGGGTDVAPYRDLHGGQVLNATIDRYAYATVIPLSEPCVRFVRNGHALPATLTPEEALSGDAPPGLHLAAYRRIMTRYNAGRPIPLELCTFCDAPSGSGLGSSSALVVAMVRALAEVVNAALDDYLIASLAFDVERVDCAMQGGKQDQYSAAFGGVNFIEFHPDGGTVVNPLRIRRWILCELETNLLLFYTGISRDSARIIAEQSSNMQDNDAGTIEAMHAIKREAVVMKECLLKGDFAGMVEAFRRGWESKKRTARNVSNATIEEIYDAAIGAGALAGKVSGAGGGGFIMFLVPPERRTQVAETLGGFDGHVSNCHFTEHGCEAWTV